MEDSLMVDESVLDTDNAYYSYLVDVTKDNCNARLTVLYEARDNIGTKIDKATATSNTDQVMYYDKQYRDICQVITRLCKWRSRNPGCLLEGDEGYHA